MNSDWNKRMEQAIDRELKALPELAAPASLAQRVMARLELQIALPWYRQGWQQWPMPAQAISLVLLLAFFSGLCYAGWKMPHLAGVTATTRTFTGWFSGVGAACSAFNAVVGAAAVLVKQISTGFLVGCLAAAAMGLSMCLGLTTVYVRLALARR